jgi:hypothetical protein
VEVKTMLFCNECRENMSEPMYTLTPEFELDVREPAHFCSSVCLKRFFISWAPMLEEGRSIRGIFDDKLPE